MIASGSKAVKPADPVKTGYTFEGWFKEASCTNAWNFASDTVAAETTLYAKWTYVTAADVLATVADFPISSDDQPSSATSWKAEEIIEDVSYVKSCYLSSDGSTLVFFYLNEKYTAAVETVILPDNGNYICDICGKAISNHADEDSDHVCDICEEPIIIRGDVKNDYAVNSADPIYLLRHTMRPEEYPLAPID